jgi:hypothetical protein
MKNYEEEKGEMNTSEMLCEHGKLKPEPTYKIVSKKAWNILTEGATISGPIISSNTPEFFPCLDCCLTAIKSNACANHKKLTFFLK